MRRIIAFMILICSLTVAACSSSPKIIQTGGCGGIRGGCRGYEIRSDGTILRTEFGYGAKEKKVEICKNRKAAEQLFEKLRNMSFTEIRINEIENIYAYISLEAEGSKHQVSWWRKDETSKVLNNFMEEELQLFREVNCTSDTR